MSVCALRLPPQQGLATISHDTLAEDTARLQSRWSWQCSKFALHWQMQLWQACNDLTNGQTPNQAAPPKD
jgi:hypothetical protein